MIRERWHSLTFRLTRKLVLWQVLTLVVFALIASIPISRFASGVGLDDRVVKTIADAVEVEDGVLRMAPTKDLNAVRDAYPAFWFHVVNEDYGSVSEGPISAITSTPTTSTPPSCARRRRRPAGSISRPGAGRVSRACRWDCCWPTAISSGSRPRSALS
jgi:hypothetical protein